MCAASMYLVHPKKRRSSRHTHACTCSAHTHLHALCESASIYAHTNMYINLHVHAFPKALHVHAGVWAAYSS